MWKTTADPYVGKLNLVRVFSGTFKPDTTYYNSVKERDEKVGPVFVMRGKHQENVTKVSAGSLVTVAKLADTTTGDTLCKEATPIVLSKPALPDRPSKEVANGSAVRRWRMTSDNSKDNVHPTRLKHISVCICTYKRPEFLKRLLDELGGQETDGGFSYSIVIVDNDELRSAQPIAASFAAASAIPVRYCVEPQQNIAMARNRAVENADGDFVAFIDDDEFPIRRWLCTLMRARDTYGCDGVLGPVKRYFDQTPPNWILKGNFYERPTYPTGLVIDWRKGRTGNVLLKKELFAGDSQPFKPEFRQGEDQEFFSRMITKGHVFVWCNEAEAYEVVPPLRWKRSFMLRRALLRGAMEPQTPAFGVPHVIRSLIAVPAYLLALPFALLLGQHKFMPLLVSLFDHLGKLLALVGINPVKEQYVTE